jgi:hypothetical protein
MAADMVRSGGGFAYSTWYWVVHLASGGSASVSALRTASFVMLLVAVVAKMTLSYVFARRRLAAPAAAAVAVLACVVMPLIEPSRPREIYIGQISANVWHNSTLIFAMPFSLLAFMAAVRLVERPSHLRAVVFGLAMAVSTSAKPNLTLALLPVVCVWLVLRRPDGAGSARWVGLVHAVVAGFPSAALLLYQYTHTFGAGGARGTRTVLAPLANWEMLSPDVLVSAVVSVAGPAVALAVLPRASRHRPEVVLAWSAFALAALQMALLAETSPEGVVLKDGNFFWGAHAAIFLVFLVTTTELCASVRPGVTGLRRAGAVVAAVLLVLHAASGVYYAARAGVDGFPVTMELEDR